MLESAIESLARSGRLVRLRELGLGYMPSYRAALSGAIAALLFTYGKYYWYAINALFAFGLRWIGNRTLDAGPPPPFELFVYGELVTAFVLVAGAALALIRRWSIRKGRFLVIQVGPIAQLRAGWHVPVGVAVTAVLTLTFNQSFASMPTSLSYLMMSIGSLIAIVIWESIHDALLTFFLSPREKEKAVVEFDLKEAFAQDETAVRWQVNKVRFDSRSKCAVLIGEFPSREAEKRVTQVAMRVKGVETVELIGEEEPPLPPAEQAPLLSGAVRK